MTVFMRNGREIPSASMLKKAKQQISTLRIVLLQAALMLPISSSAQNDAWLGGAGNWSNGAKWSAGVPTSSSNVLIDNGKAGASPVTLDTGNGQAGNVTVDSDDSLSFNNGSNLNVLNSVSNSGTISMNSSAASTLLFFGGSGDVNLTGGGALVLGGNANNFVDANIGTTVHNQSTIQGGGTIGPHLSLNNTGTINANLSGATLTVSQGTGATDPNKGTMQATSGGILRLQTDSGASIDNTGGTIKATGSGSQVLLTGFGTVISGGTLTTSSGGVIVEGTGFSATLTNLTNTGTIQIQNGGNVNLNGSVTNNGTIQLNSSGSPTLLSAPNSGTTTLAGTGVVMMGNNAANQIDGSSIGQLSNQNTIQGVGLIGPHFSLLNQGTINANVTGATLAVTNGTGSTDPNNGIMEATNGGILRLQTDSGASIDNTNGTIEATGSGSQVLLTGFGTRISGGTLTTSSGGLIVQGPGFSATLTNLTNAASLQVQNGGALNIDGTVTNSGNIMVQSAGSRTLLQIPNSGTITLAGHGKVALNNPTNSVIDGNGANALVSQNTIMGSGMIGPHLSFNNLGTLSVPAKGLMVINGTFQNFSGTTLTGGQYIVKGTLQFTGANIVISAANINLSGAKSQIVDQNSNNALAAFATNTSKGVLTIGSGKALATSASFSNAGKVTVKANSGFQAAGYTQTAGKTVVDGMLSAPAVIIQGGQVFGKGTITGAVQSSGTLTAGDTAKKAGQLSVAGSYTQNSTASLNIQIGGLTLGTQYSQLAVANGASLNGTLNLTRINSFVPAIGDSFTILTTSVRSGQFAMVNGLNINSGEHFQISYGPTSVTLNVVAGP